MGVNSSTFKQGSFKKWLGFFLKWLGLLMRYAGYLLAFLILFSLLVRGIFGLIDARDYSYHDGGEERLTINTSAYAEPGTWKYLFMDDTNVGVLEFVQSGENRYSCSEFPLPESGCQDDHPVIYSFLYHGKESHFKQFEFFIDANTKCVVDLDEYSDLENNRNLLTEPRDCPQKVKATAPAGFTYDADAEWDEAALKNIEEMLARSWEGSFQIIE